MRIKLNGKEQVFDNNQISIARLLTLSKVDNPDMVSVQLNGEFVKKANLESTYVNDADTVDFLYFMGGGA